MKRRPKQALQEENPAPVAADGDPLVQIKVWLLGVSPMVWRRMLVPAACTLRELHILMPGRFHGERRDQQALRETSANAVDRAWRHLLLQMRTRALDGTLRPQFERWYPGFGKLDLELSDGDRLLLWVLSAILKDGPCNARLANI